MPEGAEGQQGDTGAGQHISWRLDLAYGPRARKINHDVQRRSGCSIEREAGE